MNNPLVPAIHYSALYWPPAAKSLEGYYLDRAGHVFSDKPSGLKQLKPQRYGHGTGQLSVIIQGHVYTIARLMVSTFLGPPPMPCAVTRFRDGNNHNLRLDNLGWASHTGREGEWLWATPMKTSRRPTPSSSLKR